MAWRSLGFFAQSLVHHTVLLSCALFCSAGDQTCGLIHARQVRFPSPTPQPAAVVLMAYLLNGLSPSLP